MVQAIERDVDATDYAVLKCLAENDGCWKKQVHEWVDDNMDILPQMEEKSVQTIGRRIDDLQQAGALDTCILNPDTLNREIMIGFKLNDTGTTVLAEKRREFLRDQVACSSDVLLGDGGDVGIDREPLLELVVDEFQIGEETRDAVLTRLDASDLAAILAVHYFLDTVDDTVNQENEGALKELLRQSPKLREPIAADNVISRIRGTMVAQAEQRSEVEKAEQLRRN